MAGRLEGKVCIITGTGGGMGRAAAKLFAQEADRFDHQFVLISLFDPALGPVEFAESLAQPRRIPPR